jgi:hypothetical protein
VLPGRVCRSRYKPSSPMVIINVCAVGARLASVVVPNGLVASKWSSWKRVLKHGHFAPHFSVSLNHGHPQCMLLDEQSGRQYPPS